MTDTLKRFKEVPEAQPHRFRITDTSTRVDIAAENPYVFDPSVTNCQLELNICPLLDTPVTDLTYETGLNAFEIAKDPRGNIFFPFDSCHYEGTRTPGFKLFNDNSNSPHEHLGPHQRVCWTITFPNIPKQIAAVVFSISTSTLRQIGKMALHLYPSIPNPSDAAGPQHRTGFFGSTWISRELLDQRAPGKASGTIVVAILARSDAWWHLHVPSSYADPVTAVKFTKKCCVPPSTGGPATISHVLRTVHDLSCLGYGDRRTITVSIVEAQQLPIHKLLEQVSCGLYKSYARGVLDLYYPRFDDTRREHKVSKMMRALLSGTARWDSAATFNTSLCVYNVTASDARILRVTMHCGSSSKIGRSSLQGGDEGGGQWPYGEVPMAGLWQLVEKGKSREECLLEVRLQKAEGDESDRPPGTVILRVAVMSAASDA